MSSKKKTYKPKSKNVSLLSTYLSATKNTFKGDSKTDTNRPTTSTSSINTPKSRFYGNSSKY